MNGLGVEGLPPKIGKDDNMNEHILITYATRAGSTAEVAAEIGKSLSQKGFLVDVKPVKEKPSLDGYSAVILGSAIRMGNWLPEAVDYIEAHQEKLNTLSKALFTVHMLNTGEDEASRSNRLAYLDQVRPFLKDAEEVYFEGVMDFSKLTFLDRMIAKMVKAVEDDNRDWKKIRAWVPEVLA
jgi:menaquinone-dependent protoporphyrinogen oxidase